MYSCQSTEKNNRVSKSLKYLRKKQHKRTKNNYSVDKLALAKGQLRRQEHRVRQEKVAVGGHATKLKLTKK